MNENRLLSILSDYKKGFTSAQVSVELILAQIKPESGWISVDDRLPEEGDEVIILCHGDYPRGGYYLDGLSDNRYWNKGDSDGEGCYDSDDVTHWMKLPQPPKNSLTKDVEK